MEVEQENTTDKTTTDTKDMSGVTKSPSPAPGNQTNPGSPVTIATPNSGSDVAAIDPITSATEGDSNSNHSSPLATTPLAVTKGMTNGNEEKVADKGHPERKRRASSDSMDSSVTKVSGEGNDDENDDQEDDDEKPTDADPERLKAFNMFVRLFVDENLDRVVPISKQPKEKVQAILEACDRQFPEYRERARKRIRTYLKSCRRLKKNVNGQEVAIKQTPPHLTSAAAENILAQACENESHNAKRMRMGLEPLPANLMTQNSASAATPSISPGTPTKSLDRDVTYSPTPRELPPSRAAPLPPPAAPTRTSPLSAERKHTTAADYSQSAKTPTMFRTPQELTSHFLANGGAGLFRPGFPAAAFTPTAHVPGSLLQPASLLAGHVQNGPTDLSMKSKGGSSASTHAPSSSTARPHAPLSASELSTIKSLIAGYRESAAFLYRSADELEQLLSHQQN